MKQLLKIFALLIISSQLQSTRVCIPIKDVPYQTCKINFALDGDDNTREQACIDCVNKNECTSYKKHVTEIGRHLCTVNCIKKIKAELPRSYDCE